jgi:hypothetical protein
MKELQLVNPDYQIAKLRANAVDTGMTARVSIFADEMNLLSKSLGFTSASEKHVAYAWLKSSKTSSKPAKQTGGNPATTMPSEYFGRDSGAFYAKNEIAMYEANIDATPHEARGEMHLKELSGGSYARNMVDAARVVEYAADRLVGVKLNVKAKNALVEIAEVHARSLSLSKAKGPVSV